MAGGVHGWGCVWAEGGMHGRGCAWQGGCMVGGHVRQGACVAGGDRQAKRERPFILQE